MSDMGEDFNFLKKLKQEKRSNNRESSAKLLADAGIKFEAMNIGAHLIVSAGIKTVDFWPGTGLWIVRGDKVRRRGVHSLIAYVKKANK